MIYLFHGSDIEQTRRRAFDWIAAARRKEPNLSYARLAAEEVTEPALADAASAGGLFVRRLLVLLDDPFAKADRAAEERDSSAADFVLGHLDELAASDNAIVILAPKLAAAAAKKISAKAAKTYEYKTRAPQDAARGFNANLVNALGVWNRERLWLEVVRALRAGDAPEQLHGLLHWKARDLMQKESRAWPADSARQLSLGLLSLLRDSRNRSLDLSQSLERWSLSL